MGDETPQPPRQFDDLSLKERVDALMAAAFEEPPEDLVVEWVGSPIGVVPTEVKGKVRDLIQQRQQSRAEMLKQGTPFPPPEAVFKGLNVDPKTVHGRIASVALAKIPNF